MKRLAWLVFLLAFGLSALAGSAPASSPQPDASESEKTYWQGRHRELAEELAWAKHAHDTAVLTYDKRRQRQRLRGEKRAEVKDWLKDTKDRLEKAEEAMAAFPEEARRAGALPGWFREPAAQPVNVPQSPAHPLR